MYQYINNEEGNTVQGIIRRISDGASIPFDNNNADYQEYLEWVAEGNEPEPSE